VAFLYALTVNLTPHPACVAPSADLSGTSRQTAAQPHAKPHMFATTRRRMEEMLLLTD